MKAWEVIANTDDVGDLFCWECDCRTPTPVFAVNASEINGAVCDGCGAMFSVEVMDWEPVYANAVEELKEACNGVPESGGDRGQQGQRGLVPASGAEE